MADPSRKPEHRAFGDNELLPTVWTVDDAWFEGAGLHGLAILPRIPGEVKSLQGLTDALKDKRFAKEGFDCELLRLLASLAQDRSCNLVACNFDYLEDNDNFERIDRERNAVLVDLRYEKYAATAPERFPEGGEGYGVYLLKHLLAGRRCKGDFFFVTGYPEIVRRILDKYREDGSWWPIRCVPVVIKDERIEDELKCFFSYFLQGVYRDPVKEFAHALLRTNPLEASRRKRLGHPNSPTDILDDFPLRSAFVTDYADTNGMESFKALYFYEGNDVDGKGERWIAPSAFREHLAEATITVDVSGATPFLLPIQPGMLFVICLIRFCKALDGGVRSMTIRVTKREGGGGAAVLEIPLDKDKQDGLRIGLETAHEGGAIDALRSLLSCDRQCFVKEVGTDGQLVADTVWVRPSPVGRAGQSARRIYAPVINKTFQEGRLCLSWEWS